MPFFSRFRSKPKDIVVASSSTDEKDSYDDADLSLPELTSNNERSAEALDLMADMIYRSCWSNGWVQPSVASEDWRDEIITGVVIRSQSGAVRSCPGNHDGFAPFESAFVTMNVRVAIKMHSKAVDIVFRNYLDIAPDLTELFIDANTRIQVLETISELLTARKNQYAAFVRDEAVLCVWADDVSQIIAMGEQLDKALVQFVWEAESGVGAPTASARRSSRAAVSDKLRAGDTLPADVEDPSQAQIKASRQSRPRVYVASITSGGAMGLAIVLMGLGLRALITRYSLDGDASRFALVIVLVLEIAIIAFPCSVLVSCVIQMFGPISQFHRNSMNYSAIRPERTANAPLSSITVQVPVYKEDLDDVIRPTIESLKVAMRTYERQGGIVNVIVCDDGLQLLDNDDRQRRVDFYKMNNLAHTARPPHGKDGFLRRGRFKKAGNLNFCNALSWKVEDTMDELRALALAERSLDISQWSDLDETVIYDEALASAIEQSNGQAWASGDIRIGEIILLIDSDTRVPEDCFMDASMEMLQSPEVAIIQHASGVMQVAHHFFENGIAFFTRLVQLGISFNVANGDVAPFVGHNAFLRWSALQECALIDDYDGQPRIWSENHVSEDFQVALKLQSQGWILRWATYSELGFEEGVSLTCNDERSRWQKYAWGCSEIVFNPFKHWPTRGPFTKLFRSFLWSSVPIASKWSIAGYIFSYYAMALGWCGPLIGFFVLGVFGIKDTFYVNGWQVFLVCLLLFTGLSNVAFCVLRYRLKLAKAGQQTWETIKWLPFFCLFFSGLSFSVSCALVFHLISFNMSWTSTSKSVEKSNFFRQLPIIFKVYWAQITISVIALAGLGISTSSLMPVNYRVGHFEAIFPVAWGFGCHLIWAFALNPFFLTFTF